MGKKLFFVFFLLCTLLPLSLSCSSDIVGLNETADTVETITESDELEGVLRPGITLNVLVDINGIGATVDVGSSTPVTFTATDGTDLTGLRAWGVFREDGYVPQNNDPNNELDNLAGYNVVPLADATQGVYDAPDQEAHVVMFVAWFDPSRPAGQKFLATPVIEFDVFDPNTSAGDPLPTANCTPGDVFNQQNTQDHSGYDEIDIYNNGNANFYVAYSLRTLPNNRINSVAMYVIEMFAGRIMIFGAGYPERVSPTPGQDVEVHLIHEIISECLNRDVEDVVLDFGTQHDHGDHLNSELPSKLQNMFGYQLGTVYAHVLDYNIDRGGTNGFNGDWKNRHFSTVPNIVSFGSAANPFSPNGDQCQDDMIEFDSLVGGFANTLRFRLRTGHTGGAFDAMLYIEYNGMPKVVEISGSARPGVGGATACPAPGNRLMRFQAHEAQNITNFDP